MRAAIVLIGEVVEKHAVAGACRSSQGPERRRREALRQNMIGHALDGGFPALVASVHEIAVALATLA